MWVIELHTTLITYCNYNYSSTASGVKLLRMSLPILHWGLFTGASCSLTWTCTRKSATKTRTWTPSRYKDRTFMALSWLRKKKPKFNFYVEYWGSLKEELKTSEDIFPWKKWTATALYGKYTFMIIPDLQWWCPLRPRRTNWTKPAVLFCYSYTSWQERAGIPAYLGAPRKTVWHKQGQTF